MLLPRRYQLRQLGSAALVLGITVVAAVLRMWAAAGDLWLDEVWSIESADQVATPLEIVTRLHSDNNHVLNTAYVAWLGNGQPLLSYRLLSVVAGTLAVLVVGKIAAERGRIEQWIAMLLVATSFLMIQYTSEARGYALVVLFALTAYASLLRYTRERKVVYAVGFASAASFGFLAHPTFFFFYVAASLYSFVDSCNVQQVRAHRWPATLRSLLALHGAPAGTAFVLYLVHFRHLHLGGGPQYDLGQLLAQTGSLAVGGPTWGPGAVIGGLLLALAVGGGLWVLFRDRDDQRQLIALCIVLPLVAVIVSRPPFLFTRYFLIAILFAQIACAYGLGWLCRLGRLGRFAGVAFVAVFIAANGVHVADLYRTQRGHYLAALEHIAQRDSSTTITIGSNHDHGISLLVDFYAERLSMPRKIAYCRTDEWPAEGPNWLILQHDPTTGAADYQDSYAVSGQRYELSKFFDSAILSGWQWYCYQKAHPEASLAAKSSGEMVNETVAVDR